jgi:hypothetical protein
VDVISQLREKRAEIDVADPRLVSLKGLPVMTHAFFPGGNGFYEGIDAVRAPLPEDLRVSGIQPEKCFFTNAWPFLHDGGSNLSGMIGDWLRNPLLMKALRWFFRIYADNVSA